MSSWLVGAKRNLLVLFKYVEFQIKILTTNSKFEYLNSALLITYGNRRNMTFSGELCKLCSISTAMAFLHGIKICNMGPIVLCELFIFGP